jgi:hypothetical protein
VELLATKPKAKSPRGALNRICLVYATLLLKMCPENVHGVAEQYVLPWYRARLSRERARRLVRCYELGQASVLVKVRENDELDLGLQKTYVLFYLGRFLSRFFRVFRFGDPGAPRGEKKAKQNARAAPGTRSYYAPPAPPPRAPLSGMAQVPRPVAAKGPFSRKLSALSWPV